MASVFEVYSVIRDLANKDARGMVSPSQFNAFAAHAQVKVFNSIFKEFQLNKKNSLRQVDGGGDKNRVKQLQEDISVFSKTSTIAVDVSTSGLFEKPVDMARIISMTTNDDQYLDEATLTVKNRETKHIDIVYDEAKLDMILRSSLSTPTIDTPVALVSKDILVFPTSIENIRLRYYKTPEGINPLTGAQTASQPKFGYTVNASNQEVYDINTTVDFELPDHYVPELVLEIAKMMGVSLRQADVFQYTQSEETNKRYE